MWGPPGRKGLLDRKGQLALKERKVLMAMMLLCKYKRKAPT
jgi:hypothetical protein